MRKPPGAPTGFHFAYFSSDYIISSLSFSDENRESTIINVSGVFISRVLAVPCLFGAAIKIKGPDQFGCMDMYSSPSDTLPHSAKKARTRRFFVASGLTLAGIVLVCLILILKSHAPKAKPAQMPAKESVAELVSATGIVFVGQPGSAGWHQATVGARLTDGDLVQTDNSGEASIRYSDGATVSIQARTIFTVRNAGDGSMEISVPSQEVDSPSIALKEESEAFAQTAAESDKGPGAAVLKEASLFIRLDRIIPFGRSLELIGRVEAGSRLTVNNETVDVTGDGNFKHFTNPFPVSAQKVRLIMKVADLGGRIRIVTTTHDFSPQGRDN
jgi:hypothetical protein